MRIAALIYSVTALLAPALAQGPPAADIYLAELDSETQAVSGLVKITDFEGYNNQPAFLANGDLLYTSIRDGQADIYRYGSADRGTTRLTYTAESEYSPTPIDDDQFYSAVRVEWDNTQRLWRFPIDGGAPHMLLKTIKPVGYHLWLDQRRLALFILGEPHFLAVVSLGEERPRTLLQHIGRCIKHIPGKKAFSAVVKEPEKPWMIKEISIDGWAVADICTTLEGAEDYAWTPNGALLMAQGATLYRFRPGTDTEWVAVAEMKDLSNVGRIAVSVDGQRIALVDRR